MADPAPPARILCRTGEFAGATFEVEGDVSIGRHSDNSVSLQSPLLSRKHARVWFEEGRWWIEDLGSRNGTKLDGTEVTDPVPLDRLAVITLADAIDVVFVQEEADVAQDERLPPAPAEGDEGDEGPPAVAGSERGRTVLDAPGFGALPDLEAAPEEEPPAAAEEPEPPEHRPTMVGPAGLGPLPDLAPEDPKGEAHEEEDEAEADRPRENGLERGHTVVGEPGFEALPDLGAPPEVEPEEPPAEEPLEAPVAEEPPGWALSIGVPGAGPLVFALEPGETVLGRAPDCDVTIPDPDHLLSRRHAAIRVDEEGATITDLGSANGTWVGDERVETARLQPGDTFRLGPELELTLVRP